MHEIRETLGTYAFAGTLLVGHRGMRWAAVGDLRCDRHGWAGRARFPHARAGDALEVRTPDVVGEATVTTVGGGVATFVGDGPLVPRDDDR